MSELTIIVKCFQSKLVSRSRLMFLRVHVASRPSQIVCEVLRNWRFRCASVRLPQLQQLQEKEIFRAMSIVRELVLHADGVSWDFGRMKIHSSRAIPCGKEGWRKLVTINYK